MSWHQTIIVGNLGGDPELKYMQSGSGVCNFSVAVTEKWKDNQTNESREKTTWYRVAVWGNQAEPCNTYLKKGSQVMVIGNVSTRAYKDESGEAKSSLEITARQVQFLGGGNGDGQQSDSNQSPNSRANQYADTPPNGSDIPF